MKKAIVAVVVVAILVGGWWWMTRNGSSAAAPKTETKRAKAETGDLTISVSATGDVTPIRQIELKSKASGLVVRFKKLEGDTVEAGELIAELDRTVNQREVERAKGDLMAAQARHALTGLEFEKSLKQAESEVSAAAEDVATKASELDRQEKLEKGVATETDLANARLAKRLAEEKLKQVQAGLVLVRDRKDADLKLAQAEVIRAETTLKDAEERLRDTDVRSPITGILLKKLVEEGQIVSSGISATSGGTAIAIVADVTSLVVVANVDETDIGRVAKDRPATVTVESQPDKKFQGKVDLIPPRGDLDSSIIVFKVRIAIDGKHFGDLKIGMTATVNILVNEVKQAVLVPSEAVKSEKGKRYVMVPEGETGTKRVDVKIGLDDGQKVEIKEGLKAGDDVVIVYSTSPASMGSPRGMRRF